MTWAALCALRDRIVYFKPGMCALHLQRTVGVGSGVSVARASGPCLNGTHSPGLGGLRLGTEAPECSFQEDRASGCHIAEFLLPREPAAFLGHFPM